MTDDIMEPPATTGEPEPPQPEADAAEQRAEVLYPDDLPGEVGSTETADPESGPEDGDSSPPLRWSDADVVLMGEWNRAAQQFNHDLQTFAAAKARLAQITDKQQAAALRAELAETETYLRGEHDRLLKAGQQFAAKAQKHTLAQEERKLASALPELASAEARKKTADYLRGYGFAGEQLARITDHRLVVLAEKARRYDEMAQANNRAPARRKFTIPRRKAPARQATSVPRVPLRERSREEIFYGAPQPRSRELTNTEIKRLAFPKSPEFIW